MKPYTIHHGDCLEVMPTLGENTVDTILTDPPYGLNFMGKDWDHGVPGVPFWVQALRVAKPGAMLMAFGGTRTSHRLTCAIEDAGWIIRDCMMWIYGSGFPKSLDLSKAIDKAEDYKFKAATRRAAVQAVEDAGLILPGNSRWDWTEGDHAPGDKWWAEFLSWLPTLTDEHRERIERSVVGTVSKAAGWFTSRSIYELTVPATEDAKQWEGWGTAMKPAYEPIILAMKPLDGTFAQNAVKWGVAGLWIDGARIATDEDCARKRSVVGETSAPFGMGAAMGGNGSDLGRWPANVILDEEAARMLDEQSGILTSGGNPTSRGSPKFRNTYGEFQGQAECHAARGAESGGASRFFYVAKASAEDRTPGNDHPTVKPVTLMEYLARLTRMPADGEVLDPFCGSGSTGVGVLKAGRRFRGIEMNAKHVATTTRRLDAVCSGVSVADAKRGQGGLFPS